MKIANSDTHLSYCTNIHPGESWQQVRDNLERHLPTVRSALLEQHPQMASTIAAEGFGIGLRLSGQACYSLLEEDNLENFQEFLERNNFYVFTLNGFPYGTFHGERVKEDVYLPDWRDPERSRYSKQLAKVLAALMPPDSSGSISTVPVAFKNTVNNDTQVVDMARAIVDVVIDLIKLEQDSGQKITLALEPEPCCYLETVAETISFFDDYLRNDESYRQIKNATGIDQPAAEQQLHDHLSVCLDVCHAAVEFEDPDASVDALLGAGIEVGKLQISSGLRMRDVTPQRAGLLEMFDDKTYLHQVVENHADSIRRYPDLDEAFAAVADGKNRDEWRVHCHVPLFLDDFGDFSSTQFYVSDTLKRHREKPISNHLEVETYTWSVLPQQYRGENMDAAIARELGWVLGELAS